jgi:ABC-type branched-subunit amino acid transport system substrate-binding protein
VPQAIFGYEAMSAMLAVLREAGSHANNRSTVVHDFLAIKNRPSALGTYSMNSNGDTSIAPFVFSRVRQGKLVPFAQVQG